MPVPPPPVNQGPPAEFNKTSATLLQKTKSKIEVATVNKVQKMMEREAYKTFMPQFQPFGESSDIVMALKRHGKKVAPL